jgi:hypothetical protein
MISILQNILPNKIVFKIVNIHVCFLLVHSLNAQIKNSSFSSNYSLPFNKVSHSSIQPYLESSIHYIDSSRTEYRTKLGNKLFENSLLDIVQDDIHIEADPLFNFTLGPKNKDLDYRYYSNVRGFRISADLSDNFSFETRFYENQFFYPLYLQEKSNQRVIPQMGIEGIAYGIGRAKSFKEHGHDASLANGYLSFSPTSKINFQFGHGRHFFGDGYRSLLISDYAPDYPYISGQYFLFDKKILYKHVTSWMKNLERIPAASTPEALFIPKSTSFNQLSYSPNKRFSISLFEGGVYQSFDIQNGVISPDISFFLPIIGTKAIDADTTNNIIYGFNWSFLFFDNLKIYNQIALKSFNFSSGVQLGIKWLNPLKISNSFLNFEWNFSPSGLYSMSQGQVNQSYSHLGHELAHPLGSGFQELLIRGQFCYKNTFLRFNYNYANFITDYSGNEIFDPLENLLFSIKSENNRWFLNTNIGIMLNKATKMEISIGHITRIYNSLAENYVFLSWRTNLKNDYFDQ